MLRTFRKIIMACVGLVVLLLLGVATYLYTARDRILQQLTEVVNDNAYGRVQLRTLDIAPFRAFPNLVVDAHDVVIKPKGTPDQVLLAAQRVSLAFDWWKLLQREYVIVQCTLVKGEIQLYGARQAQRSGGGVAAASAGLLSEQQLQIQLRKLQLQDVQVSYGDTIMQGPQHVIKALDLQLQPYWEVDELQVGLEGKLCVQKLHLGDQDYAAATPLTIRSHMRYDVATQRLQLEKTYIEQGSAKLQLKGSWGGSKASKLAFQGSDISPQLLCDWLPVPWQKKLTAYRLQGPISADLQLSRSDKAAPMAMQGTLAWEAASLTLPGWSQPWQCEKMSGTLTWPNVQEPAQGRLKLQIPEARLATSSFKGEVVLHDFQAWHVQVDTRASLDLATLAAAKPHALYSAVKGQAIWQGQAQLCLSEADASIPQCHGTLTLENGQGNIGTQQYPFSQVAAQLLCQGDTCRIEKLTGQLGESRFSLQGGLQSWGRLLQQKRCAAAQLKLYLDHLDVDTLSLHADDSPTSAIALLGFALPLAESLDFTFDLHRVTYQRFLGKHLQGKLQLRDKQLRLVQWQGHIAHGKGLLSGTVDMRKLPYKVHLQPKVQGMHINQLFDVFQNFNQDFITDRHLRGTLFADANLFLRTDKQGVLDVNTVQGEVSVRLHNGILQRFEPLQNLTQYIAPEALQELHFPALGSRLRIKDQTIHIPPIDIHSSLTRMQVSGTHTFDGKVNYKMVVPLKDFRKVIPFGLSTDDALAGVNLVLRLEGTTTQYALRYDLSECLQGSFQEQGNALKQLLRGAYRPKKPVKAPTPDDYFEFD